MKSLVTALFLVLSIALFTGCTPDPGPGGKATIKGKVTHHGLAIPNAVVYIKYGASEFPGESASSYDKSTNADQSGSYSFSGLNKGKYYLYGIGFDTIVNQTLKGGIPVEIKKKTETLEKEVPVTE